jgi:osmotically inducible protein OsmC
MAEVSRTATVSWQGDLARGGGEVELASSRAAGPLPISFPSRAAERTGGLTSPEELIAAAHASCYAMSLSGVLARGGSPPESLEVSAEVTIEKPPEGGIKLTSSDLRVRGRVPDLDSSAFEDAARQAERSCPVSNALRGNLKLGIETELKSGA